MKYVIDVTDGTWLPFDRPCKNAEVFEYMHRYNKKIRDENGKPITQIQQEPRTCWTVELNTLEDLNKLHEEMKDKYTKYMYEGLIFLSDKHESGLHEIEIYIGYRE